MNDIPSFEEAHASFEHFLTQQGYPCKILWVFRDDIWKPSSSDIVLRCPLQVRNLALAKKVFEEGRAKGLVEMHAIATVDDVTAATVWFPKFTDEEIQGWDRGMKLSITQPLPKARRVSGLMWLWFRLHPGFRHYQRSEFAIATKAWAASSVASCGTTDVT